MSDLFEFNGAKGSGWSQPEPMKKDAINTVPASLRRSNLPRWPRAQNLRGCSRSKTTRAPDMVSDPEAGVMVTAVLRVMILFDKCKELLIAGLNAWGPELDNSKMTSLPEGIFRHTLNFRGPLYEYARRFGTPSARWADEYVILGPAIEYEIMNGRTGSLEWNRPCYSVRPLDMALTRPTRASF